VFVGARFIGIVPKLLIRCNLKIARLCRSVSPIHFLGTYRFCVIKNMSAFCNAGILAGRSITVVHLIFVAANITVIEFGLRNNLEDFGLYAGKSCESRALRELA
jgi:hypothetical protein